MKKAISIILTLVLLLSALPMGIFSITASATTDGYYTFTISNGEVTITDVNSSISGDVTIPSDFYGYPVVSIDAQAFTYCYGITSITIPNSVKYIGFDAFYSCTALEQINIHSEVQQIYSSAFSGTAYYNNSENWENNVLYIGAYLIKAKTSVAGSYTVKAGTKTIAADAFQGCSNLVVLTIPEGVINIGQYAFSNCTGLIKATIPSSLRNIEKYAFSNCVLETVHYGGSYRSKQEDLIISNQGNAPLINSNWYYGSEEYLTYTYNDDNLTAMVDGCGTNAVNVVIPSTITKNGKKYTVTGIESYAFISCDKLASISIPNSVTSIGDSAFYNCTALTNIIIPNSVTKIGSSAFYNCISLTAITIPESVTSIGSLAFYGCEGITSITVPNGVTSIGDGAFKGCSRLESISLPFVGSSRTASGTYDAVFGYVFGYSKYSDSSATYQHYGDGSSYYYIPSSLKTVTITDDTTIPYGAFYNCIGLTELSIPDSVTDIGISAFEGCSSLKTATIPNGVTRINKFVFENCTNLESINIQSNVEEIDSSAFNNCNRIKDVYYFGSYKNRVEDLKIESYGNSYLIDAKWHYGAADYLSYTYNEDGLTALVKGCDVVAENISIPSTITKNGNTYIVVGIEENAFNGCSKLVSVSLPNTISSIGSYAFCGCASLEKIVIPDSVTSVEYGVFSGCQNLKTAVIGNSVQELQFGLFENCVALKNVTIGNKVLSIDSSAFDNCVALENVDFNAANCTSMGTSDDPVFLGCINLKTITIGNNVTNIPAYAFNGCVDVTGLVIPDGVVNIGEYAFEGCSGLKTVTIGSGVTKIGDCAFKGCTNIETLYFNAVNCTEMGRSDYWEPYDYLVFAGCGNIKTLIINDNVTNIPSYAFTGCTGLKTVTIGKSVNEICSDAFKNCTAIETINYNAVNCSEMSYVFEELANLKHLNIGESVVYIPSSAFYGCRGITELIIPDSVINIYSSAFSNCSSLKNVILGQKVKYIGSSAFYNCHSLESITLPRSLNEVEDHAFEGCSNLTDVYYMSNDYFLYIGYYNDELEYGANWHYGSCIDKADHVYDDNCDKKCNDCGTDRVPPHTYSNNCDASCNGCDATRTPPHSYKATVNTKATTSKNGKLTKTCSGCGKKITETIYYAKSFYLSSTSYTYNGKVQTPVVMVYDSAGNNIPSKYYTVTYSSGRKNVGTYKVTITLKGNYSGTKTLTYKINPISISKCNISLSATSYTYDGKTKTPTVYVYSANGSPLKNGTHYTVSYSSGRKNVGTYKVTIKMKGTYSGSKTFTYKINPPKTSISKITLSTTSFKVYVTKKSTQVTGYQIQYSLYDDFLSATTKTLTSYKTTSASISGLTSGATYYVRVRTYKTVSGTKYYSGWSTVMMVTTK